MVESQQLSRVLKDVMKGGKFTVGARESIAAMKGSKAVLCTRSIPPATGSKLREEAKKHNVAVVDLDMTSAQLARLVGRPFKVSAMALRSISEADLKQLAR